jgi:hypothetical protein
MSMNVNASRGQTGTPQRFPTQNVCRGLTRGWSGPLAWLVLLAAVGWGVPDGRTQETVTITEFLASNAGGLQDEDGDSSDWIELLNAGASAVNLFGWHLTDTTNELTQWTFPATSLAPQGFLVVFASGKDRAVTGAPLHTSFGLNASGGYLALVRPDGVTVASEWRYGPQRANYSYGLGQTIAVSKLIPSNAPVRVLVPTSGSLGLSWTGHSFNDASWIAGTNGVGYELAVPGFAVRNFKANVVVDTLAKAEAVIATPAQQSAVYTENSPVVNYLNTGSSAHYASDRTVPGLTINADVEDYVMEATATITIPAAGAWTFGVNSDDGFSLAIGSSSMSYPDPRGPADTLQTFNFAQAGDYALRLVFYERGGGSEVELFAAQGSYTAWGQNFRLVGDTANGGLAVRSLPIGGGGGLGYRPMIRTDVQSGMLSNNASIYLRFPFSVTNAAALQALTLSVRYDDGFVAYLNGVEVARRNAPGSPLWNSTATAAHAGLTAEAINLADRLNLLQEGGNLLALHGLNDASRGLDFFMGVELAEIKAVTTSNQFFPTPTPAAFNGNSSFAGFVADTKFSPDRGFYETNFSCVITTATPGAIIRYTRDGSWPSTINGTIYTGPILITNTTTLRAIATRAGLVASDVDTHTYVFPSDVVQQSPTGLAPGLGWPSGRSSAGQLYDYGMDPDIVNTAPWNATIKDDLQGLPSFSIVMDLKDLFDNTTGIYANPGGDEITWERPCSLELINPDGSQGFQINCGIRIRGGYSRSGDNPKHAFRFFFRQEYGAAKLVYPLFGDEGADTFNKIDLRTFQNYCWAFNGDSRMICLRDQLNRDMQLAMGQPAERGKFYHLYVNGQYWGLYNTDERPEASYGETYLGGRAEDYDTIKVDPDLGYNIEATDGNSDAWYQLWTAATAGFSSDASYFKIQGRNVDGTLNTNYPVLLDVDNLIDYMLVIIWGGNLDAPISAFLGNTSPNNFFAMRNRTGLYGGFRFFAHDSEHTFLVENLTVDRTGPFAAGDPAQGSDFSKSNPQYLWQRLSDNAEFRLRVADHIQTHFFNGGPLSTAGVRALFMTRSNEIYRAMVCESARWGDAKVATPFTRATWLGEMSRLASQFIVQRPGLVLGQLQAKNLFPNVSAPVFSSAGGYVSNGFNLYLTNRNPAGMIYGTFNGADPRVRGGAVNPAAVACNAGAPIPINSQMTVCARVLNNSVWSALAQATFFVAQDYSPLLVTEIMYNPPVWGGYVGDDLEFLELKNAGTQALDLSGLSFTAGVSFTFTNGTRLLPGQFFVLGRNPAALAARYPGLVINGVYTGKLDNGGEALTLTHLLGGTILSFGYKDSGRWPLAPDGRGFSLVPRNPNANPDPGSPMNWRASSAAGGSPGTDDPPATLAPIVVNEALTHTDLPDVDWIELYNPTETDVDIGGWLLTDDGGVPAKFRIPDGTMIPAHGYRVFTEADFNPTPGTNNSFALGSSGDQVYLFSGDAQTNLTGYSHGFSFGAAENGVTFGRYLNSVGDEHFVAQISPTRAAANSGPRVGPVVVREIMYHPPDLPGGVDNAQDEYLFLQNITGAEVPLFDPAFPTNTWRLRGGTDFNFPTNVTLPAGGSLVLVGFDPTDAALLNAFRTRYGQFMSVPALGPYLGKLDNGNQSVELCRPDPPDTNGVPYVLVEQVHYADAAPWPPGADGSGSVLQRRVLGAYGNDPTNWTAAAPLTITGQPQSLIVSNGANATFAVSAFGTGTLRYQWQHDGVGIPGATNSAVTIVKAGLTNAGAYTVVVTDDLVTASSQAATLTVLVKPVLTQSPQSQTVLAGSDVTFTAAAYGTTPMGFRWRRNAATFTNGVIVNTPTSSSLTLTNITPANNGAAFTVVTTNLAGSTSPAASSNAVLTVLWAPIITAQPTNQTANPGGNASLAVVATGNPALSYQWWFNQTNLLAGATNATLTLTNLQATNDGAYFVMASNALGNATSQVATLTVRTPPVIVAQPQSQMAVAGTNVTFTVNATGASPLKYQWRLEGAALGGATNSALLLTNVQAIHEGGYSVVVSNSLGFAVSEPATLTLDSDGDGLPDSWETVHGLAPNDPRDVDADADQDGLGNRQEYLAGTDPQDPQSCLRMDASSGDPGVVLAFLAVSNKTYTLQWREALGSTSWQTLTNIDLALTNRSIFLTNRPVGVGERYYRLVTPRQQ